jgi:hypothetical protein
LFKLAYFGAGLSVATAYHPFFSALKGITFEVKELRINMQERIKTVWKETEPNFEVERETSSANEIRKGIAAISKEITGDSERNCLTFRNSRYTLSHQIYPYHYCSFFHGMSASPGHRMLPEDLPREAWGVRKVSILAIHK